MQTTKKASHGDICKKCRKDLIVFTSDGSGTLTLECPRCGNRPK